VVSASVLVAGLSLTGDPPAAGATTTFTDLFERASGPVANGWNVVRGSWAIQSGSVVASGPLERILARATEVGPAYAASTSLRLPNPPATGHAWAGVATNIVDHGDGTQSFYALRVAQSAAEASGQQAQWQLVRIDHSTSATGAQLLARGAVTATPGTRLGLSATAAANGAALVVRVTGVTDPVERRVALRNLDRLPGGRAGLYSNGGTMPLDDFTLQSTTQPDYAVFNDDFQRADGTVGNGWQAGRGTWQIAAGVVSATSGTERVIYPSAVTLGHEFTVRTSLTLPAPAPASRSWAGVAVNLSERGDGTQDFYALRVAQSIENGGTALWQVVRVTASGPASLLKGGGVAAPPGSRLGLTLTSRNLGTGLEVGIVGPGLTPVNDYVPLTLGNLLSGGRAGLYSNSSPLGLADFGVITSTRPANPPTQFAPLNRASTLPDDYRLPSSTDVVDPQVITVDSTWAGHPVGQAILTSGADQYVAYYNAQRVMTVAKRVLPATTWTRKELDSVLGWDSHNYVTMALDSAGQLHVSGNMHGDPLVYFRTTRAGDITSLTRVATMVDQAREQSVTYPRFLRDANGALLFNYRDGGSGNGSTYYNRYDPATQRWTPFLDTPFTDGQGLRNGYDTGFTRGPDGYFHVGIVWRDTPDAGSSSMPSYVRSADLLHWENSAGDPVALPATYATADVIDPVPIYGGVVNGNLRIGFDADDRVLMAYSKYDENLTNQLYLARPDGTGNWAQVKLTNWTGRWEIVGNGSLSFALNLLSGPSPLPDGNVRLDYRCDGQERALIIDSDTLVPVADVPRPQLPAEITAVRSTFPGMRVNVASSDTASGRYLLRWESLGPNQDQPRDPEDTPPAQPLQIYLLRPRS
jgi:BNR repeat-containing family member